MSSRMPTCPGCQQRVSHDRLATHERYCRALHGGESERNRSMRRLERRIEELDRRVDQRLRALEVTVGTRALENESTAQDLTLLGRDK